MAALSSKARPEGHKIRAVTLGAVTARILGPILARSAAAGALNGSHEFKKASVVGVAVGGTWWAVVVVVVVVVNGCVLWLSWSCHSSL